MTPDWRQLTPAQLDAAYDQRLHAPNMAAVLAELAEVSAQVQARLPQHQRLAYGPQAVEALDWYACGRPQAPVLFFIHGGAWRNGQAKEYAFFVEWVLQAGVDVVVPDFAAVTEVEGELGDGEDPGADVERRDHHIHGLIVDGLGREEVEGPRRERLVGAHPRASRAGRGLRC
jgi:hypothetical protein